MSRQILIGEGSGCTMGAPVISHDDALNRSGAPPITTKLLSVRGLTVHYRFQGREFAALSNLSFEMGAGEIVGVLGESGCGKTTMALSLLGLLPPAATVKHGSVFLDETDLLSLSERELGNIRGAEASIVYQDSATLNPVIRVGEQVSEILRAHRSCKRSRARDEILELFSTIGLGEPERIYEAYPHQLSGGQRQRIAIAQALICRPRLVIADEPTASIDPETTSAILNFIKDLRESQHTSFLLVSHDPAVLASIADRILVMYAGQIVEEGPLADAYSQPVHPYTRALLDCAPSHFPVARRQRTFRLPSIPGNPPDPCDLPHGCAFSPRCADRMQLCDSKIPQQIDISPSRHVRCLKYEVD